MAKRIEFYDLDKEYPVSYEFWKDFAAFFLYTGYKLFSWKGGFQKHTYKVLRKSYQDAYLKNAEGITLIDYEIAKDSLYNNYSSFRYYFERAEKITSLNVKEKTNWTINEVHKNLYPRISPQNRLNIESDFYKNCYNVLYDKLIIHFYATNNLNVSPKRLIYDPLLLEESSVVESWIADSEINEEDFQNNKKSYLLSYECRLSHSKELKKMFIDNSLFDKIDFSKLKEYDIFYDSRKANLELKSRFKTDLVILLILLKSKKIISFENKKDMNKIFKDCFGRKISQTVFSDTNTKWSTDSMNQNDSTAFKNAELFISKYIMTL